MLLLDLLAERVPKNVAMDFYTEMKCLSRRNLVIDKKTKELKVCFRRDYSKVVGQLLAKHVEPVFDEMGTAVSTNKNILHTSSRVIDAQTKQLLDELATNEAEALDLENSCCRTCYSTRYFVHTKPKMCVSTPKGAHCCHTVCKSLQRMQVGMSESVTYCCPDLHPQRCSF